MSIKIKLNEDQVLVVRVDPEQWSKAYRRAAEANSVIEIRDESDGRVLAIPASQILFWEEVPDDSPAGATPAGREPQLA